MLIKALLESKKSLRAELIAEAFVPADMKGFLEGGNESLSLVMKLVMRSIIEMNLDIHSYMRLIM